MKKLNKRSRLVAFLVVVAVGCGGEEVETEECKPIPEFCEGTPFLAAVCECCGVCDCWPSSGAYTSDICLIGFTASPCDEMSAFCEAFVGRRPE